MKKFLCVRLLLSTTLLVINCNAMDNDLDPGERERLLLNAQQARQRLGLDNNQENNPQTITSDKEESESDGENEEFFDQPKLNMAELIERDQELTDSVLDNQSPNNIPSLSDLAAHEILLSGNLEQLLNIYNQEHIKDFLKKGFPELYTDFPKKVFDKSCLVTEDPSKIHYFANHYKKTFNKLFNDPEFIKTMLANIQTLWLHQLGWIKNVQIEEIHNYLPAQLLAINKPNKQWIVIENYNQKKYHYKPNYFKLIPLLSKMIYTSSAIYELDRQIIKNFDLFKSGNLPYEQFYEQTHEVNQPFINKMMESNHIVYRTPDKPSHIKLHGDWEQFDIETINKSLTTITPEQYFLLCTIIYRARIGSEKKLIICHHTNSHWHQPFNTLDKHLKSLIENHITACTGCPIKSIAAKTLTWNWYRK